jgi:hypothetical protein
VSDSVFLDLLNQVRERFINSGKWKNMRVERTVAPVGGVFTLPEDCESLLGVQIDGTPVTVLPDSHEFAPGGPGEVTPGEGAALAVIDQGNRTYKVMGAPNAASVRILGKLRYQPLTEWAAPTGNVVISGAGVASANGTFVKVGLYNGKRFYSHDSYPHTLLLWESGEWRILKSPFSGAGEILYRAAEDTVTPEEVAVWSVDQGVSPIPTVEVELSYEVEDDVVPSNFGALKMGFMALKFEDENDLERSESYWEKGLSLLNDETREARGASQHTLRQSVFNNPGRGVHNLI